MGSSVILQTVLLILDSDGGSSGRRQITCVVVQLPVCLVAKDDSPETRDFGSPGCGGRGYLTRPHGEEVRHNSNLRDDSCLAVVLLVSSAPRALVHVPQELRSYRSLLPLWRVTVVARLQPHSHEGAHVGRSREVHGAPPDIPPKRRSQVACGFAQSTRDHWFLTSACRSAMGVPLGNTIEVEERPKDELLLVDG